MRESVRALEVVLERRSGADINFRINDDRVDRIFLFYSKIAGQPWIWTDATIWTEKAIEHNLHPYTFSPGIGDMPEKLVSLILQYKPKGN